MPAIEDAARARLAELEAQPQAAPAAPLEDRLDDTAQNEPAIDATWRQPAPDVWVADDQEDEE